MYVNHKKTGRQACCLLLTLALLLSLAAPALAATVSDSMVVQTLRALDIIDPGSESNAALTRGALAKMLVQSSPNRNAVASGSTISPYADVPYSHWAAGYVRTAVAGDYMTAYPDGNFKPDQGVTANEAVKSLLALLGYNSEQYGQNHWQFANNLKFFENLNLNANSTLTRQQAGRLFYNALCAKNSAGQSQIETIGFSLSNGLINLQTVISSEATGPVTIYQSNWQQNTGLDLNTATVYRDDQLSNDASLQTYDVVYYNVGMNTVWAYSDKITGVYKSASPSRYSPTAIDVSGATYQLSDNAATKLITLDANYGETLVLLLGSDGSVADILTTSQFSMDVVGFVTAAGDAVLTDSDGSEYSAYTITLIDAKGQALTYEVKKDYSKLVGEVAKLQFDNGTVSAGVQSVSSLTGKIDAAANTIGGKTVANNAVILEVYDNGAYQTTYLSRLDGITLEKGQVFYAEQNAKGEISTLFLNGVSGDALAYGIVLDVDEKKEALSGRYEYIIDGRTQTSNSNGELYNAEEGPAAFTLKDNKVDRIQALEELKNVTLTDAGYVLDASGNHRQVADNVAIYQEKSDEYTLLSWKQAKELNVAFQAYYDKEESAGGRIRVLVAEVS